MEIKTIEKYVVDSHEFRTKEDAKKYIDQQKKMNDLFFIITNQRFFNS